MKEANRLQHIKEYYFSRKLKEIEKLQKQGRDIINLGIGNPDLPPSYEVIKELSQTASMASAHGYQSYRGIEGLRKSFARFYKKYFGVKLNPHDEIIPLTGSKEGIMHISMAFINPGDKVLIPDPGYLTYRSATLLAGGIPVGYDLFPENNYLPDLKALEKTNLEEVKIMWINYPHMPSGSLAPASFYKKIIEFGKKHQILIVNDNPYSFILNNEPRSLLHYDPGMETSMELNSLSKSHNMAGWRIGMLAGKKEHIDAVMKFKSNMDSGMFLALQKAAIKALNLNEEWFENMNRIYRKRKIIAEKIFEKLHIHHGKDQAGLFLWGKIPGETDSKTFTDKLLYEKEIFLTPGFIFGNNSKNYVRLSLTNSTGLLEKALKKLEK